MDIHKICLEIRKNFPDHINNKGYFKHFPHGDHNNHSATMCRTNINLRCCMPYSNFIKYNKSDIFKILFDEKKYFDGGLVIDLTFYEFLSLLDKDDEISEYLKDEIYKKSGSINNVTAILGITNSNGYSGSSNVRKEYEDFCKYKEDNPDTFVPITFS